MEYAESLAAFSFVARRNSSISPASWRRVFAFISAVTLGIAAGFVAIGAWLVLPFAGIELALLFWAFRYLESHAQDCERVTIEGDRVLVEVVEGKVEQRYEFNRCWVQVVLEPADRGYRLALRSRGIEVDVGRHLSTENRVSAAGMLRRHMQKFNSGRHHDT